MPWTKGQSGNLRGAPKRIQALARKVRLATEDGDKLVAFAVSVLDGTIRIPVMTKVGQVDLPPSVEDRFAALQWLSDRGWGKAVELHADTDDVPAVDSPPTPDADLESAAGGPEGSLQ